MDKLTEKEKQAIADIILQSFEFYIQKYQSSKYPEEPYLFWKERFPDPQSVEFDDISKAIIWKYGHWGKSNFVESHKTIILKIQCNWNEFVQTEKFDINSIFKYWEEKLIGHQNFITIAFITHLIHNSKIEIIDQHTFRAMNYFLKSKSDFNPKKKPNILNDLLDYTKFIQQIFPLIEEKISKRDFDKFLMMFGKYKARNVNLCSIRSYKKGKSVEYDWSNLDSDYFDLDKITLHSNADVLFVCLLINLEKKYEEDFPDKLTIREISEVIPRGTASISNYSTYNYAMLALFSRQCDRDYFIFSNSKIKEILTKEANNRNRNNNFWKNFINEIVQINPKYIL